MSIPIKIFLATPNTSALPLKLQNLIYFVSKKKLTSPSQTFSDKL